MAIADVPALNYSDFPAKWTPVRRRKRVKTQTKLERFPISIQRTPLWQI
jgi:hypothetical protein